MAVRFKCSDCEKPLKVADELGALLICRNQDYVGGDGFDWGDAGHFVLHYLAAAMVLHGLYDTLLKKEHEFWAMSIAALSFGWLVWLARRARSEE